jgi:hypothetical protein
LQGLTATPVGLEIAVVEGTIASHKDVSITLVLFHLAQGIVAVNQQVFPAESGCQSTGSGNSIGKHGV